MTISNNNEATPYHPPVAASSNHDAVTVSNNNEATPKNPPVAISGHQHARTPIVASTHTLPTRPLPLPPVSVDPYGSDVATSSSTNNNNNSKVLAHAELLEKAFKEKNQQDANRIIAEFKAVPDFHFIRKAIENAWFDTVIFLIHKNALLGSAPDLCTFEDRLVFIIDFQESRCKVEEIAAFAEEAEKYFKMFIKILVTKIVADNLPNELFESLNKFNKIGELIQILNTVLRGGYAIDSFCGVQSQDGFLLRINQFSTDLAGQLQLILRRKLCFDPDKNVFDNALIMSIMAEEVQVWKITNNQQYKKEKLNQEIDDELDSAVTKEELLNLFFQLSRRIRISLSQELYHSLENAGKIKDLEVVFATALFEDNVLRLFCDSQYRSQDEAVLSRHQFSHYLVERLQHILSQKQYFDSDNNVFEKDEIISIIEKDIQAWKAQLIARNPFKNPAFALSNNNNSKQFTNAELLEKPIDELLEKAFKENNQQMANSLIAVINKVPAYDLLLAAINYAWFDTVILLIEKNGLVGQSTEELSLSDKLIRFYDSLKSNFKGEEYGSD